MKWDFDRLAACLQKGHEREELVDAVEERLGKEFMHEGISSDTDWGKLINILQEEGQNEGRRSLGSRVGGGTDGLGKDHCKEDFRQAWRRRDDATMYKLSARLAGTGMGVRKRCMRSRRVTRATKEEWENFLGTPANQRGLAAEAFGFEQIYEEYKECWKEEELKPWTIDITEKAKQDIKGIKG
eukprot:13758565-Heterocapsa_arctica.AAC.1